MPILDLCSGVGTAGEVVSYLTGEPVHFFAEIDEAACKVLEHRWPGVPNLGDIGSIDWLPLKGLVTVVSAGWPCQDISNAGPREGIDGRRSGIWRYVAQAVGEIRPELVFLENVSALRSRGLERVAKDLTEIGYELWWDCIRASDIGAPHHRDRWFGIAIPEDANGESREKWRCATSLEAKEVRFVIRGGGAVVASLTDPHSQMKCVFYFPTPTAADGKGGPGHSKNRAGAMNLRTLVVLLPNGGGTTSL